MIFYVGAKLDRPSPPYPRGNPVEWFRRHHWTFCGTERRIYITGCTSQDVIKNRAYVAVIQIRGTPERGGNISDERGRHATKCSHDASCFDSGLHRNGTYAMGAGLSMHCVHLKVFETVLQCAARLFSVFPSSVANQFLPIRLLGVGQWCCLTEDSYMVQHRSTTPSAVEVFFKHIGSEMSNVGRMTIFETLFEPVVPSPMSL